MSILILNRVSNNTAPYYEWLHEQGVPLVLLCDSVRRGRVDERYDHVEFFDDWKQNGNIERRAHELHSQYHFTALVANSESDIVRAAQLREQLHLPGQLSASALAFRDKVSMKSHLQRVGVSVPTFRPVTNPWDVITFRDEQGFPFVLKPRMGMGSENTFVVETPEDLERALAVTAFQDYEVETFVDGDMYHIDGVWADHEIKFWAVSKYLNGCLAYQDGQFLGSLLLDPTTALSRALRDMTERILGALPDPIACAFHCEIFVDDRGRLTLCEIASRTGGGRVIPTIHHAYRYNLLEHSVLGQVGQPLTRIEKPRPTVYAGFSLMPPRPGTLVSLPAEAPFDFVLEYLTNAAAGDTFGGARRSVDHFVSCIVTGSSPAEVEERLVTVAEWVNEATEWEDVQ